MVPHYLHCTQDRHLPQTLQTVCQGWTVFSRCRALSKHLKRIFLYYPHQSGMHHTWEWLRADLWTQISPHQRRLQAPASLVGVLSNANIGTCTEVGICVCNRTLNNSGWTGSSVIYYLLWSHLLGKNSESCDSGMQFSLTWYTSPMIELYRLQHTEFRSHGWHTGVDNISYFIWHRDILDKLCEHKQCHFQSDHVFTGLCKFGKHFSTAERQVSREHPSKRAVCEFDNLGANCKFTEHPVFAISDHFEQLCI